MTYTTRIAPADVVSGTLGSSAYMNSLPRGRIGRSTLSADSDGTTGDPEVVCSITFEGAQSIPPDRTLQIHASVMVRSDINGGARAALYEDGVQIQRKNIDVLGGGVDQSWSLEIEAQPDEGEHTYDLRVGPSGGAGNLVRAKANGPTGTLGVVVLYVDDVGPFYEP